MDSAWTGSQKDLTDMNDMSDDDDGIQPRGSRLQSKRKKNSKIAPSEDKKARVSDSESNDENENPMSSTPDDEITFKGHENYYQDFFNDTATTQPLSDITNSSQLNTSSRSSPKAEPKPGPSSSGGYLTTNCHNNNNSGGEKNKNSNNENLESEELETVERKENKDNDESEVDESDDIPLLKDSKVPILQDRTPVCALTGKPKPDNGEARVELKFINNGRGKYKKSEFLEHENFIFRQIKVKDGLATMICKKDGCSAKITVDKENSKIIEYHDSHNHDPDLMQVAVDDLERDIYRKAKENPTVAPGILWKELVDSIISKDGLGKAALKCLKSRQTFTKKIERDRKKDNNLPKPPTTWMNFEIPEVFTKTSCQQTFLCMNLMLEPQNENSPRIIGFSSQDQQKLIREKGTIFGDGTFAFVAETEIFKQLYIFHVQLENDESVPVAYYFLPGKTSDIYSQMLQNFKELGGNSFQNFFIDFEPAMVKSIKEVFGSEAKIFFCSVHFQRNLQENLKNKGLAAEHRVNLRLQRFIKTLWALQLVPPEDIPNVFDTFLLPSAPWKRSENPEDIFENEEVQEFNSQLEEFLEKYFTPNYVGAKTLRGRKDPRFSLRSLSKVNLGETHHMTTNICESQHRQLSRDLTNGKSNLWKLITILKAEHSLILSKIFNANRGDVPEHHSPNNSKKARRVKERKRLETLVSKYNTYEDKYEYLCEACGYMNDNLIL